MSEFIDILLKYKKEREEVLNNIDNYLLKIKESVRELDPDARVLLFGSYVRGNFKPDSDIDILVISDKYGANVDMMAKMNAHILIKLNVFGIFEIHITTRKMYEEWFKKFIDVYREI
ncbi:nucleotidyltransferase domain-containing protein [Sulfolobus tengchongensis]|uniref:Nucleotidyltransferase domain-containing protein n=1 Tax=Sulfolobus tengchongensis TaxID=207809 RepID=A0AAX4L0F7_9CREN